MKRFGKKLSTTNFKSKQRIGNGLHKKIRSQNSLTPDFVWKEGHSGKSLKCPLCSQHGGDGLQQKR